MTSTNVCRQQLRLLLQQPNRFYLRRFRSLSTANRSSWKSSRDIISTSGLCSLRRCASSDSAGSYDYVIVGAGSAGCVLANKLILGDRDATVLLTESGPPHDRDMLIEMPGACRYTTMNPKYDWCYETVPQKHLDNRRIIFPRGRVLGGSSCINGMIYIRGHRADYDRWANEEGATGWSYEECLPYFIRSQSHALGANQYRGSSGLLRVEPRNSKYQLHDVFIQAGKEAGYPITDDFNGVQQEGFGNYDLTTDKGRRASTAATYLRPLMTSSDGRRLTVMSNTLVRRVQFDDKRRAVGIEFQTKGKPVQHVTANKEVILCGGAVNSPQLLMLSGIGPADHLRQHGIQVVHHSPGVGENLNDHPMIYIQYACTQPVTLYRNLLNFPFYSIKCGIQWLLWKSGDAAALHLESGAFLRSRPDVQQPDIQIHFLPWMYISHEAKLPKCHGFQFYMNVCRPTSRGTIKLQSADPSQHPAIDANFLATADDMRVMKDSVHAARKVVRQRSFDQYRGKELLPGSDHTSDSQLEAFIRASTVTIYHPTSTCRMGSPDKDDTVVVDTKCRVVGVDGLRVVDASVMPSVVSGNTNAPTVMIAEKVSDLILGKAPLAPAIL